ncbi:MAG: hypothetical protein RIE24_21165 [Silicimonas sp.]
MSSLTHGQLRLAVLAADLGHELPAHFWDVMQQLACYGGYPL